MAPRPGRVALLGLALTIVGGVVGYRVAMASHGVTEAVARDLRPAPLPMQASLLEAVPIAEKAPSAAPDLTREQRLREFQEALANAWREGLAQGATAMPEAPAAPASPPIPTASTNLPAVTNTPTTTAVADLPIASATADLQTPPPTPSAPPSAPPPPPTTAPAIAVPTAAPAIAAADAGLRDLHVVIYSASWCDACQEAKAWMTAHRIAFEERDINASREYLQELRLLSPSLSIPTFDIDGDVMVGFNRQQLAIMVRRAVLRRREGGTP